MATGHERLQVLQVDALARGLTNALRLNAIALTLFSLTVFSLAHLSSALDRQQEYKILRVIGLSIRQSVALLVIEGCLVLLLGLAAGTAVGLGLSQIMIPFFLELFAEPSSRAILPRVAVDWPSIVRAYLLLAAIYGSTLASLSGVLIHTRVHWTQGKEDE